MYNMVQSRSIVLMLNVLIIYITYYLSTKIINKVKSNKYVEIAKYLVLFFVAIIYRIIRNSNNMLISMIALIFLLSITFSISTKNKIGYSLCITVISLSISYILYVVTAIICYLPISILRISNMDNIYLCFIVIATVYVITVSLFLKIKRFKKGFAFLQKKLKNDYFDLLILNISTTILFLIIIIVSTRFEYEILSNYGIALILFIIIMFITIQKSLKLYYKQKMLIKDLNETKEELENKKEEIEELEKENLNFSKTSHSIAHKQKALEYKLNKLLLNNEIADEIDLKGRLEEINKELKQETTVKLKKTDITEIDDMLAYMQSECIKNKIDFQLQLSGNIHHMVNNYIDKEKLEILLADLIKNAIIAINYSENTNKSILVRLGIIDGIYSLYVYDSGIEFEQDTLSNIGKKPSTTHADNGGTGMGMMNTFDTLKQYKASMEIHEYGKPCKENFTKVIKITFDKKNEFKIVSYRRD